MEITLINSDSKLNDAELRNQKLLILYKLKPVIALVEEHTSELTFDMSLGSPDKALISPLPELVYRKVNAALKG